MEKVKFIKETEEELSLLLRKIKDIRIHRRVKTLYLLKIRQYGVKSISEQLEVSQVTIYKYINKYKKEGIDGLLKLEYEGRQPRLRKDDFNELKEKAGKDGFSSLKEIQEWIKEKFDTDLSVNTVGYWCKKLGIKKKGETFTYKKG